MTSTEDLLRTKTARREPAVAPADTGAALPPPRPRASRWSLATLLREWWRTSLEVRSFKRRRPEAGQVANFRCAMCGGRFGREMFASGIPDSHGYSVVRCDECALVATWPAPDPADIPSFYGSEYYGDKNAKFGTLTERAVLAFRLARARSLRRMGVPRGPVLDVGCARGLFLRAIQKLGYEPYGTELDALSGATAQQRLGPDRIRFGTLSKCGFADEQFVAITAWQVFEHLSDPLSDLEECHRILSPGGVLILDVPNFDGWQARWSGSEWFHLDVPRHLFHFTPESLSRMLRGRGFDVESITHHNFEQDPFGFLQSAAHRLGGDHMGLYGVLKGQRCGFLGRVWRLGLCLAAAPLAVVLGMLWARRGSGATFTVHARKVAKPAASQRETAPVVSLDDVPAPLVDQERV